MLDKIINAAGQKAHQRQDSEDRSLIYRNWLRTVDTNGFWMDLDLIKYRKNDGGVPLPVAITEITRTDKEEVGSSYLEAIIDRIMNRDMQGKLIDLMSGLLKVPAYLVLFPKSMSWVWVFSFQKKEWRNFTPLNWSLYLKSL